MTSTNYPSPLVSRQFAPRSTQLLVWSAPVLLVVLVFVLMGHAPTRPVNNALDHPTTTVPTPTTTTAATPVTPTTTATTLPTTAVATNQQLFAGGGAQSGTLDVGQVTNLPLAPLSTWSLQAPNTSANLTCSNSTTPVTTTVSVGATSCTLTLTGVGPGATWELTPQ